MASPALKKSKWKKILLWIAGSFVFLILLAALLIYIFQDKIKEMALRELGERLNAKIEVSSSSVTFWSTWPQISVTLHDLHINPIDSKPEKDIIYSKTATFQFDFWSLFSSHYKLSGIDLQSPRLWLLQDNQGKWNYGTLFQPKTSGEKSSSESEMVVDLQRVRMQNGSIHYSSLINGNETRIDSLEMNMSGIVSGKESTFNTNFDFFIRKFVSSGVPLFPGKHVHSNLKLRAEYEGSTKYILDTSVVNIAAVELALSGSIEEKKGDYLIDLAFKTRRNTFESFVSLLPGNLLNLGKKYKHDGQFRMNGWVKGLAGSGKSPDFFAEYDVAKGFFQYEGYKGALRNLDLSGSWLINNKLPALSHFRIANLQGTLNDHSIEGKLEYKDFLEPKLTFNVHGALTLEDIRGFYPTFADSTQMEGTILADLRATGLMEDFKKNNFEAILADGNLDAENVSIRHPNLAHPIHSLSGKMNVDNGQIKIESLSGGIGKSDFKVEGTITEYLPYLFDTAGVLTAKLKLESRLLDLDEWFGGETAVKGSGNTEAVYTLAFPQRIKFNLKASVDDFRIDKFQSRDLNADCFIENQKLTIRALNMNAFSGSVKMKGSIGLLGKEGAEFDLNITSRKIDINKTFHTFDQLAAFSLVKENLSGLFSGIMDIRGKVNNRLELEPEGLFSTGEITLEDGRLVNFKPLEAMAGFIKIEKLRDIRFSDVTTEYKIENQRFMIPKKMKVNANDYKLTVSGSHGFDNTLDYRVVVELPRKEAQKSKSSDILGIIEEAPEAQGKISIPIWVTGTVDYPKFKLDFKQVGGKVQEKAAEQKSQMKEGGEKEVEKIFGKQDTVKIDDLIIEEKKDTSKGKGIFNKIKNPFHKAKSR